MTDEATTALPTIAMLGGGNMNGAILAGLLESPSRPGEPIRVTTKTSASAERYAGDARVRALAAEASADANRQAVRGAGIVVLGVKPYGVAALLEEIRDDLEPDAVVISVAAGVPSSAILAVLGDGARVVRAMPNTPATIGLGVTGIAPAEGAPADADALALARAVFASVGEVVEVEEAQLAAVAAASGSGPAYVYLLAERMIQGATTLGLGADAARELVVGTIQGAAEMMARDPETTPAELRRRVTSPNGTTERAIRVFESEDLEGMVARAMAANAARSAEMAEEYGEAASETSR